MPVQLWLLQAERMRGSSTGRTQTASLPPSKARPISPPMTEAPTYIVKAFGDKEKVWKTVLATKDEAAALAMKAAIEQDGVLAEIETIPPG